MMLSKMQNMARSAKAYTTSLDLGSPQVGASKFGVPDNNLIR